MTIWIGTSFKMTKSRAQSVEFATRLARAVEDGTVSLDGLQSFLIPSFLAIPDVVGALHGTSILTGAQDAHWEDSGACTGSVSMPQLIEAGARLVELGHAERRAHFGETDETVRLKVQAALRHGLIPIVCVGESAEVSERGRSSEFVRGQLGTALAALSDEHASRVVVAYEPLWAIGATGRRPRAEEVAGVLRDVAREWRGRYRAMIFGGGVDVENAASLLQIAELDGLFPGRSAWDVDSFLELLRMTATERAPAVGA